MDSLLQRSCAARAASLLFCASRLSDATRRMSATELVLRSSVAPATPSHQQLRRSSTNTT